MYVMTPPFCFSGTGLCEFRSVIKIAYKSVSEFGESLRHIEDPCLASSLPKRLRSSNL